MGGNDPSFGISISEHVENIKKIAEELNTQIVWCTSTPAGEVSPKNSQYEPYAEACMQIPQNENFQLVDVFNLYKQFPLERFFTFVSEENLVENVKAGDIDLQHPNQLGNAYIDKIILKEVFGIEFNAEKYIQDTLSGEKYPEF